MHILRWLMKHPIMLAWLLAIVAILLNFSMGSKSGEHAKEVAAAHSQEAAPAAAPAPAAQMAEQAPAPEANAQQVATPEAAPAVAAQQQVAAAETAKSDTAQQAGAPAPQQAATPAQAPVAAAAAPAADTPADLLRAAREAYWSNELDRAIELYTTLVKQSPDSLEYKGELANVYWKQGNSQQAATLFAEVAPKLAEQGRVTEALNMKLYVDMVSPELAKQIDASLKK